MSALLKTYQAIQVEILPARDTQNCCLGTIKTELIDQINKSAVLTIIENGMILNFSKAVDKLLYCTPPKLVWR